MCERVRVNSVPPLPQLLATPFLVGVLFLPPPWAFLMLLPAYVVGEMWIGVCLVTVVELVPLSVASAAVALYLFIINNIGGNVSLLLPPLQSRLGLRYSLLFLFPGCYLLGALFFFITFLLVCCVRRKKRSVSHRVRASSPKEGLIQAGESDEEVEEDTGPEESLLDWGVRIKRTYDTNDDQPGGPLSPRHLGSVVMYTF